MTDLDEYLAPSEYNEGAMSTDEMFELEEHIKVFFAERHHLDICKFEINSISENIDRVDFKVVLEDRTNE